MPGFKAYTLTAEILARDSVNIRQCQQLRVRERLI
jgi:hypothetical protein